MTSAGIIGAAVGCGLALLFIIGFIIFRHKNQKKCMSNEDSPSPRSYPEISADSASKLTRNLAPVFIQPDGPSSNSTITNESMSRSHTLFPTEYHRKLSSSTGCSSHSNDNYLENLQLAIKLHYRIYYDLDNCQLILHLLEAHFKESSISKDLESPVEEQITSHRETYVTFYLSGLDTERRCGQTKIAQISSSNIAGYDEIFALPTSYESLLDQRLHFEMLNHSRHSKPQPLGSADVALGAAQLDNQDAWVELTSTSHSTDIPRDPSVPRPEVLVFLSFHINRGDLHIDILKAKNLSGLFPIHNNEDTEIYIKTCLIVEDSRIKRRTKPMLFSQTTNATVIWNESLAHKIAYSQLESCVLLLYFCVPRTADADKENTVGKCVIGPFGGAAQRGQLQWQQQGNAQFIRSNAVWTPVLRYSSQKGDPNQNI